MHKHLIEYKVSVKEFSVCENIKYYTIRFPKKMCFEDISWVV